MLRLQRDKHVDAIVGYITAGDTRGAYRYYAENRVSFLTYAEAERKARAIMAWHAKRDANLCITD